MSDTRPSRLAERAAGSSVTPDTLREAVGGEPLHRSFAATEQPQYIVRGSVCDIDDLTAPESGAGRKRKVASPGSDLLTVVTDRRVLVVVPRPDGADRISLPLVEVSAVRTESAPGGNSRLQVESDGTGYYLDSSDSPFEEVEAARAFIADHSTRGHEAPGPDSTGPLEKLERLAALHERGALSDEEFEAKKQDLLDRV